MWGILVECKFLELDSFFPFCYDSTCAKWFSALASHVLLHVVLHCVVNLLKSSTFHYLELARTLFLLILLVFLLSNEVYECRMNPVTLVLVILTTV